MPSSIYVVQTNPVPGREAEYRDWYDNRHLDDVLAIPGFRSAVRYERSAVQREARALDYPYRSLAIYEFDGDPRVALDGLTAALQAGLELSPALADDRISVVYEPVSERRAS